jgi:hypothetical protein
VTKEVLRIVICRNCGGQELIVFYPYGLQRLPLDGRTDEVSEVARYKLPLSILLTNGIGSGQQDCIYQSQ